MIVGAAFCPHPPALVPDLAGTAAPELDDLRAACAQSIEAVGALGRPWVVIGSGPLSGAHSPLCRGSFAPYGLPLEVHLGAPTCGGELDLPLSVTVGAWLLAGVVGPRSGARGFAAGPDFAGHRAAAELLAVAEAKDIALLVMGDGSARRSTSAPGYLDERAAGFDGTVARALAEGDTAALLGLDGVLADELWVAGVPAWQAAARLLDGARYASTVRYDAAPYGVGYFVAEWIARG